MVRVLGAEGILQRRLARPGLKGGAATEILDGELKVGETVAVRIKSAAEQRRP